MVVFLHIHLILLLPINYHVIDKTNEPTNQTWISTLTTLDLIECNYSNNSAFLNSHKVKFSSSHTDIC